MDLIKLLPIFVLLVFIAGCAQEGAEEIETPEDVEAPEENETPGETAPPETAPEGEGLVLDITFSKETYAVGEEVEGDYVVENYGEAFEGIVAYKVEREGFDKTSSSYIGTTIAEFTPGMMLSAVEIDENGYYGTTDSFPYPGTYIYSITVYDCADVEAEFGHCEMFDLDKDEVAEKVAPVGEVSKSIQVVESS